jgi:hypothetical protein
MPIPSAVQVFPPGPWIRTPSRTGNNSVFAAAYRIGGWSRHSGISRTARWIDSARATASSKFFAQMTNGSTHWLQNMVRTRKAAKLRPVFLRLLLGERHQSNQTQTGGSRTVDESIPLRPKLSKSAIPPRQIRKAVLEPWTPARSRRTSIAERNSLSGKCAPWKVSDRVWPGKWIPLKQRLIRHRGR